MRVALSFPGCHRRGGVERVMLESVNFLARRGHETHAFATDWEKERLDPAVICHQVASVQWLDFLRVPAFVRACRSELVRSRVHPDILAGFGAASPAGSVVWMTSVHAAWIEISQQIRRPWERLKQRLNPFHPMILHRESQLLHGRQYRKVIALTDQVRADVQRFYGVPEGDIEVIPNGFSPEEFNLDRARRVRARMRERLGIRPDEKVVLFVANEIERKGLIPLLRAVASLHEPDVSVLAVGRLSPAAVAREIERLKLKGRVRFAGPTSHVADFFGAADIFALPTYYEAWGLVIVEALACGLPVITSKIAGAAVAVRDGENGFLLDEPRDPSEIAMKLRSLLNGQHGSSEAIADGVQRYSWDKLLLRFEKTLESCL